MSHHHHDQRFADRDVEDAGASVLISHQSNNDNAESTPVAQQSTPVSKRKRDNDDATPPTKGHRTVSKNTNSNSVSVASTSAVAATTSSTKLSAEELDAAELAVRQTVLAHGCRSVDCYQQLNAIEEGSYGVVYRARDIATGVVYALKQVKMETTGEGFPVHALREISILIAQPHPNIVAVREMVVGNTLNKIYMVMEFVDHDIKALMDRMERMHTQFATSEVKCLMLQVSPGGLMCC
jgi:cell division cycle 2-like protein